MARRAPQPDLFPNEDQELWIILETIREKAVLTPRQLAFLEQRLAVTAPIGKDDASYLCAVWRGAWSKAFAGAKAPWLGEREAGVLKAIAKQAGGAGEAVKLIEAFFIWRREQFQLEERRKGGKPVFVPDPTPFALQQNFVRMKAIVAEHEAKVKRRVAAESNYTGAAAAAAGAACPPPEGFRKLKRELAGEMTEAEIVARRAELAAQAEQIKQNEAQRGLGG